MLVLRQVRVFRRDGQRMMPRLFNERQIGKGGDLQVRQTTLPRAKQFSRSAQVQIRLRYFEPVTDSRLLTSSVSDSETRMQ